MTTNSFWHYSLDRYSRDGVPAMCLELQDQFGTDVNLVLFALWIGHEGQSIETQSAAYCVTAVEEWHQAVVRPMRGVRRWLKGRNITDTGARDQLRAAVQKWEIEAERMEQQMLFDLTTGPNLNLASGNLPVADLMVQNAARLCFGDDTPTGAEKTINQLVALCL